MVILFALVAGNLVAVRDSFTTRSGRKVDLAVELQILAFHEQRRGDEPPPPEPPSFVAPRPFDPQSLGEAINA